MRLRARAASDEIPTASMADIAFLLIIYFMVTTTFAATRGLDFAFPEERQAPAPIDPVESVLVDVQADGSLRVDNRPLPLAGLLAYLRPRLEQNPLKPVIIKTDPTAPYGAMVDVFDELRHGKPILGLDQDIVVSIPTRREQELFWR